jgi:uncharacterized protein HemY
MSELLIEAINFIKAGDKEEGKRILVEILTEDEKNEVAWLWLSAAVETNDMRQECLEEVIKINPNNQSALKALSRLQQAQA